VANSQLRPDVSYVADPSQKLRFPCSYPDAAAVVQYSPFVGIDFDDGSLSACQYSRSNFAGQPVIIEAMNSRSMFIE
jgi:hypothetical protein